MESLFQATNLTVRRRTAISLLGAAAALCLALVAQRRLDALSRAPLTYVLYGAAGVLFAAALGDVSLEHAQTGEERVHSAGRALAGSGRIVAVLLVIALCGCLDFGGNRFRPAGVLAWGGGLLACLAYLYLLDGPARVGRQARAVLSHEPLRVHRSWLVLGLITLVGAVLRLWQLDVIPADIGWDLPYNYTDVLAIQRGEYHVFFPANQGRESLFMYLAAWVATYAPLSHFSLKLTSAIVGILTIPAIYALGRELYGTRVALLAAAFLAVNHWHMVLSRAGFRVILLPLFVILVLNALARALRKERPTDFALLGLCAGLGLYTYTSFVFVLPVLGIAMLAHGWRRRQLGWRAWLPLWALMAAVLLIVAAPLLRYALEHPQEYFRRVTLQARLLTRDPNRPAMNSALLLENVRTSLLMYHVYGDSNVRFNVPFLRHFGFFSAVLLVPGLAYALRRWRHGNNAFLLLAFFLLIVPMTTAMFPHEMPNVFRAAGTIGPGMLLVALPVAAVAERLRQLAASYPEFDLRLRTELSAHDEAFSGALSFGRRGLLLLLASVLSLSLVAAELRDTTQFYFRDFRAVLPDKENVSIAKEMARVMQDYGDLDACYIKVWPHWFDGRALQMAMRQQYGPWNPEFTDLVEGRPPLSTIWERGMVIVHPQDGAVLQRLRDAFPRHATVVHRLPDGNPAFIVVYVER